ncbi:MAG: lysophospholipase L1-like esterase [Limisphaerales bacterium]|nr:MAG: lysophospholipase L1-like esterase [Limisphaerales bacterium]KAG0507819.1 MAG: lysophospholipase L1-like esterase [Limisphaerales bacterium]TXT48626.1 MAG: lysophospholipase L1-like esterase [Limisphaerales bacterium]
MKPLPILAALFLAAITATSAADKPNLDGVRRIVFLGDSITYGGAYVDILEAAFRVEHPDRAVEFINIGLPSETVSGLSEPGHAGGAFPRPTVHERLDRVLAKAKPDLIVACYGMNCGMYYPFSEERFAKYREGMELLRKKAAAIGAKVVHITPPVFDPMPIKARLLPAGLPEYKQPFEGYNTVLDRYSEWLVSQRAQGWLVFDAHFPMAKFIAAERERDPAFKLAGDGVHINATGHWLIAREVLRAFKAPEDKLAEAKDGAGFLASVHPRGAELLKLIAQRQGIVKDAWLNECGHLRPGMKKGVPVAEAKEKWTELEAKIAEVAKAK